MEFLLQVPKLDTGSITAFLENNNLESTNQRKTRNSVNRSIESISVTNINFGAKRLIADVLETVKIKRKSEDVHHKIEVIFEKNEIFRSVHCTECIMGRPEDGQVCCTAIVGLLHWLQQKQTEEFEKCAKKDKKVHRKALEDKENMDHSGKRTKKTTLERNCHVLIEPLQLNYHLPLTAGIAVLTKVEKEPVIITPHLLKAAQRLSLFNLIQDYEGTDPDDFLAYCTKQMEHETCANVQLLTVEQADNDLWHELRKGRITASRMYEASRCTMLNGSLTNKVMGVSSGFSFAMKRGTDLEGHVLAELQKEFPSLRSIGLVLDPKFPWMGASPDGISDDFVLEIKCPYTAKTHACYVDVNKLSKKYFAQIQLQMHMTRKTKALLGVAALDFEKTRNVTKVWIDYDKSYVENIMADSYEFWSKGVFKALQKKRKNKK
ncbi:uncharacterized protein LOC131210514 [Anopheles bellator]|uniref:uncharacterized protein LOC131210514 n=1 Tax=Anopheles bellator TaxID=139047 RepID=UPI002647B4A8|nr:uncharacterized protein LOC131210514 [Anopheles bellator]